MRMFMIKLGPSAFVTLTNEDKVNVYLPSLMMKLPDQLYV
jgi:hypothetical protein